MSLPMAAAVIGTTMPCAPVSTHLVCSLPTLTRTASQCSNIHALRGKTDPRLTGSLTFHSL